MIKLIQAFAVICVLAFTFSCENCETCTSESVVISAGVETSSGVVELGEVCGDDLDTLQDTAVSDLDADGNGIELRINCN